ncbi:FRIGIDA-like protein 5 [Pyrus communis]|uniref:FRIGIDA-like protein 5 n=1 Tax=Pyrus communis TaxID=23211 RepID=UPI0035BF7E51
METMVSGSDEPELKQRNLVPQWKHLLDHIDSLQTRFEELQDRFYSEQNSLQTRQREVEEREKELEGKVLNFNSEMASKAQELYEIERLAKEKRREVGGKEKWLLEIEESVRGKARELDLIKNDIEERTEKLNSIVKSLDEKSRELKMKKEVTELNGRRLNSMKGSIDDVMKDFVSKQEQVKAAHKSLEECHKEIQSKRKILGAVEKSIRECYRTLESKEKTIRAVELKQQEFELMVQECQKHLDSQEKLLQQGCHGLEMKERQLEEQVRVFESEQRQFDLTAKERQKCLDLQEKLLQEGCHGLEKKEGRLEEKVREFESNKKEFDSMIQERQQHLDSQEKLLQEGSHGLEMKERQLEEQVRKLESEKQQFESLQKSREDIQNLKSKEKTNCSMDGKCLQVLMNENWTRTDLVCGEIAACLQASSDPAKLVLDAMQGFYPSNQTVDTTEFAFDLTVIRRSCIFLLQQLKRFSPQINPQVRKEARALAAEWKGEMTVATENGLEILGFLELVAVYEITTAYDSKELQSLLGTVAEHEQGTELCQALGITTSNSVSFPIKIEEQESSQLINVAASSSLDLQPSATTDTMNLQGSTDEHLSEYESVQNEMLLDLQMSMDPAELVLKLIKESLSQCWRKRDVGCESAVVENSISLLNDLTEVSMKIGPHVKKNAIELAVQWKAKMRVDAENSMEILVFLNFVATYGLVSTFNRYEIVKLLGTICLHKKALESCQAVGFADMIPDFVQDLIERKQLIEAVRLICGFNLSARFPPVPLLKEYVEGARRSYCTKWLVKRSLDEMNEVVDKQIADLSAAIHCIKDNHLESEFPYKGIEKEMVKLEKHKLDWRRSVPVVGSKGEGEQEKGKKPNTNLVSFKIKPPEQRNCKRLKQLA